MFNQELLSYLLIKSQGDRSLNKFSKQCGISSGNLSKIRNGKISRAPQPGTLEKIAMNSNGTVTYEELMKVCNYINDDFKLSESETIDISQMFKKLEQKLTNPSTIVALENEVLCPEAIEILVKGLAYALDLATIMNKSLNKI